jgi:DeoR/GlpR family transcriptional regulator of sugar metabolism
MLEAEVDRAMVEAASEVIVVADSSKIGVIGLTTIIPVVKINKLITDDQAPSDFIAALQQQGVEVILA